MSAPALRFKDADGREFPKWSIKRIADVCNKVMDGTHFSPKSKAGPRKYLTSKNVRNYGIDLSDCSYISEEEHQEIFKKCPVSYGDILLTKDGANTGNCCINTLNEEFSLLSSVAVLSGRTQVLNNQFLLQILQGQLGGKVIRNAMAGQAISRITLEKINKFVFCLPSLSEQTKIANFLTAVDEKLAQLTRKLDLLTQYKKGVIQQIFNQELRFKDDDGREFAEWKDTSIGKALTIGSGKDYKHLSVGEIPVYGTGGYMLSVDKYLYDGESVCIGRKGTIDKPVLLTGKFWTVDTLFYTHSFKNCLPKFIYAYFQTVDWKNYNEASGVPSLSKSTIEKIAIQIPCVAEQTKIANFLTAIDDKINATQTQLAAVKQYKQGLLQQMFV